MKQKYVVYIGGMPLYFGHSAKDMKGSDTPLVQVEDRDALGELIRGMHAGTYPRGAVVEAPPQLDVWSAFADVHVFVQAAGGMVMDEKGRLLAIRRLGKWDLPKGKVEKGEAIDKGAVREVHEECGLKEVELVELVTSTWHTYERKGKAYLKRTDWFLMRSSSKERLVAQSEEDIEEVRWLDAAGVRMMELDTYPSLLPVLHAWRARTA